MTKKHSNHFFTQSRLEECLKKQTGLQRALDVARKETENEKQVNKRARSEWEREREAMKEKISELRDNLRHSCEMLRRMEGKQQVWKVLLLSNQKEMV